MERKRRGHVRAHSGSTIFRRRCARVAYTSYVLCLPKRRSSRHEAGRALERREGASRDALLGLPCSNRPAEDGSLSVSNLLLSPPAPPVPPASQNISGPSLPFSYLVLDVSSVIIAERSENKSWTFSIFYS